ncbi:MAG: fibronectin type III-like domain-contianing protein, partial [Thermoproteota archaeon]
NEKVKISLEVLNTGEFPGKEVVQVYIRAPKAKIDKPFQELKEFYKTRLLNPNEKEKVEIEIDLKALASYNGEVWLVEKGEYEVRVGSSSRDIRLINRFIVDDEKWRHTS